MFGTDGGVHIRHRTPPGDTARKRRRTITSSMLKKDCFCKEEHVRTGQPPFGGPADRPLPRYDGQSSVPNGSENNNVYTAKTTKQSDGSSSVKQATGTESVTATSGIGRSNDSNQIGQIESTQASNEEKRSIVKCSPLTDLGRFDSSTTC